MSTEMTDLEPMRYSVHRWAPTQPTPSLDYVLWLRETVTPDDIHELTEQLERLAQDAEDHHQESPSTAHVMELVMRYLAHRRPASSEREGQR